MRPATQADAVSILGMARRFHEQELTTEFCADRVREILIPLLDGGGVFITPAGFIAGMAVQNVSDKELTAHEVLWWSEDGRGADLRRAFENWAHEVGCSAVEISHPSQKKAVGRLLGRVGYKPQTDILRKVLPCA